MEDRPRNLKAMLAAAKDASELMVDLAYASLYFGDHTMAEEVTGLEEDLSGLVHDMRAICVVAARSPRDADAMASVLQVIGAIERMGNAAVDISRIVTRRLGIPRALVADLSDGGGGLASGGRAGGLAHRPPAAVGPRAADAGRHAGRRHPPGPLLEHPRRWRRSARARRRPVPPGRP